MSPSFFRKSFVQLIDPPPHILAFWSSDNFACATVTTDLFNFLLPFYRNTLCCFLFARNHCQQTFLYPLSFRFSVHSLNTRFLLSFLYRYTLTEHRLLSVNLHCLYTSLFRIPYTVSTLHLDSDFSDFMI